MQPSQIHSEAFAPIANNIFKEVAVLKNKFKAIDLLKEVEPQKAMIEVLKFLNLIYISNERLTPSLKVDLAWHEFILCTKLYQQHCQEFYQRFIHHHPGGDDTENLNNFRKTIQLYQKHYGQPPTLFWGNTSLKADCGSCDAL